MAISYTRTTWADFPATTTPTSAANFNNIETALTSAVTQLNGITWDDTVGRRLFVTGDPALSGTPQLIYGDTGLRDISSLISSSFRLNPTVGFLLLRRRDYFVTLIARLQRVTASGARDGHTNYVTAAALPSGFHGITYCSVGGVSLYTSSAEAGYLSFDAALDQPSISSYTAGTWTAADTVDFEASWTTTDAWPSSLPGSASGSIPYN